MARTQGSHAQLTGPRIRDAAEELFAKHGFAAVSMRQIAREVGLQAGALYNYTPDKQALLFDIMNKHLEALLEALDEHDFAGDARAQLDAFVQFHMRFHLDRPNAVFIAYMELRNLTPENFERIEMLRQRYERHLQQILDAGMHSGGFCVRDARVATRAVIAMLTGVTTWFRDQGALSRDDVVDIYVQMVRKAVAAEA